MSKPVITKIEIFKLDIPLENPIRISLGTISMAENILVKIYSSDGLYGIGEGSPTYTITGETQSTCICQAKEMGQIVIGKNPYELSTRMHDFRVFPYNSTTKCAFDIAFYDLLAKRANLPLYALLGGEKRTLITDKTIGIDTPEFMAQKALEIKNQGFTIIKIKLGTNLKDDVARIGRIRDAVGYDVKLRVDANQGWDPVTAELILRELAAFSLQFCEEPVSHWNNAALRYIREKSPVPIIADESVYDHHDAFRLASMDACDYINIKVAKSGGILNALKINAIAEAAGMQCMVGGMSESRIALSAVAHFASARPNVAFYDLDSPLLHAVDPVVGGVEYDGCEITLPDSPGHGADIDVAFLDRKESVIIT